MTGLGLFLHAPWYYLVIDGSCLGISIGMTILWYTKLKPQWGRIEEMERHGIEPLHYHD